MDWSALLADSGWEAVAEPSTAETGTIDLRLKTIDGSPCLRGVATVDVGAATLYEVVTDVPAALKFSSETLYASKVLGTKGGEVHYYQHLDVPSWTMASDRFWVLKGSDASSGTTKAFRWEKFDWRPLYPDLVASLAADHPDAVEPEPNWGSWVFVPDGARTKATYYICTNPGGSLPSWLAEAAATKTLPSTMADVVREAQRRAAK